MVSMRRPKYKFPNTTLRIWPMNTSQSILFSLYELYIKRKMFKWKLNCIYWAPVGGKEVILAAFWLWWRRAVWPRKDSCKYCASYGKEAHPVTLLLRSPRCQGHVWLSCIDQSEVSIQVMWSVLTNQKSVFTSCIMTSFSQNRVSPGRG